LKEQYNVSIERLTPKEIAEIDHLFSNAGWVIRGFNDTTGSNTFRIYQWEKDSAAVYPAGYEPEPHMEPIRLDVLAYPVDDEE
jgi:hypothetical protein